MTPSDPDTLAPLLEAAARDPGMRPAFYRQLLESNLFIIGTVTGNSVSMQMHQGPRGPYLAVFSSAERILDAAPAGTPCVGLRGEDLFRMVKPETLLVLNPWSKVLHEIVPQERAALLDGSIFSGAKEVVQPAGRPVMLGQPAERPQKLLDAVASFLGTRAEVRAAYLALIVSDPALPPHCVLGVQTAARGGLQPLLPDLSLVVSNVLGPNELVDFIELGDKPAEPISQYLLEQTQPFYRR